MELRPDEKAQRWLLSISASDRAGLLYSIARVLARHDINLQLAKITTLGERVEDVLISGAQLQHSRTQVAIETELLKCWPCRREPPAGQGDCRVSVKPNWVKSRMRMG